jgi:Kdo2-lipid IVA lauroyltransferase/acyltransferase
MFIKLLNSFLFFCVCIPLSALPMWMLYLLSDILSFLLRHIIKYRNNIIGININNSFPRLSSHRKKKIENIFYKHLSDIFIEAIKELSIRKKFVMEHYHCNNPEILTPFYNENRSVILVSGHYNNWEYMVLSLDLQFLHHGIGIGKRMTNKVFDKQMHLRRTRFGTEVCYNDNYKQVMSHYEKEHIPCAYMLLADQSPSDINKCFWTKFLNQDTPVIFGPEYLAKKYNLPVFFYKVNKIKRGYYTFDIIPITTSPQETSYGEITNKHVALLEQTVKERPSYWLWSHRRWKLKNVVSSIQPSSVNAI